MRSASGFAGTGWPEVASPTGLVPQQTEPTVSVIMIFLHAVEFMVVVVDGMFAQSLDRWELISPGPLRFCMLAAGHAMKRHRIEHRVERIARVVLRKDCPQRGPGSGRSIWSDGRAVSHYREY